MDATPATDREDAAPDAPTQVQPPSGMTPPPPRSLVFHAGGIEFVVRPGGVALFASIAVALDVTFLPVALPAQPGVTYHLAAAVMTLAMIVATLLHESGHAIAYRLQGIRQVRITLRASGGACAAFVERDRPLDGLVRALAGPAMTALVVVALAAVWRFSPLPALWRLTAATLAVFSLFDLVTNVLPVHPRCDGAFALRSLVWLLRGREPDTFSVLYLWRPLVLAMAALAFAESCVRLGYLPLGPGTRTVAALFALGMCAVPLLALAWRYCRRLAPLP